MLGCSVVEIDSCLSSAEAYVEADSEGGGQESPLVRLEATLSLSHTSCSHMLGNLREHEVPSWGAIARHR